MTRRRTKAAPAAPDIEQAHRDATMEDWAREMTPAQRAAQPTPADTLALLVAQMREWANTLERPAGRPVVLGVITGLRAVADDVERDMIQPPAPAVTTAPAPAGAAVHITGRATGAYVFGPILCGAEPSTSRCVAASYLELTFIQPADLCPACVAIHVKGGI